MYNDGVFSEADMASISRVGDSGKRAQAGKTGRFGCVHVPACLPGWVRLFAAARAAARRSSVNRMHVHAALKEGRKD